MEAPKYIVDHIASSRDKKSDNEIIEEPIRSLMHNLHLFTNLFVKPCQKESLEKNPNKKPRYLIIP